MLDKIKGLHIEPTNKCTLQCPLCARTDMLTKFPKAWKNHSINLTHLKNFLDIDLSDIDVKLCGNTGDPIYYNSLFDLIDFFKNRNSKLSIETNGSYKSAEWWKLLVSHLDNNDEIIFAIDGMPDEFSQYRINGDWPSIRSGLEICGQSSVKTVWQLIPFNFNENTIDAVSLLARKFGAEFSIKLSNRWQDEGVKFKPDNIEFVKYKNKILSDQIDPLCTNYHNQHYISADGFYTSCCYVSDHRFYYKSEFHKNRERYRISNTTISQILTDTTVVQFYDTIQDAKLEYCLHNCPKI